MTYEELLESVAALGRPFKATTGDYGIFSGSGSGIRCADGRCPLGLLVYTKHKKGGDGYVETVLGSLVPEGSRDSHEYTTSVSQTMPYADRAAAYLGIPTDLAQRVANAADNRAEPQAQEDRATMIRILKVEQSVE